MGAAKTGPHFKPRRFARSTPPYSDRFSPSALPVTFRRASSRSSPPNCFGADQCRDCSPDLAEHEAERGIGPPRCWGSERGVHRDGHGNAGKTRIKNQGSPHPNRTALPAERCRASVSRKDWLGPFSLAASPRTARPTFPAQGGVGPQSDDLPRLGPFLFACYNRPAPFWEAPSCDGVGP